MEDPDYNYDRVRRRMKNIDNLKILPLDLDVVIQWSPARELWKVRMVVLVVIVIMMMMMMMMTIMVQVLGGDVMSSLWKHVHLSRLVRLSWLWKFGGLYLDTDLVVLGDLLGPWHNTSYIGLHNLHPEIGLSNAAIKLDRWRAWDWGLGLAMTPMTGTTRC